MCVIFLSRDPVHQSTQISPVQAEHFVNTMRAEYCNAAVNHVEGGWPKEVNINDEEQTKRYRRKVEREESFNHTILHLAKVSSVKTINSLQSKMYL